MSKEELLLYKGIANYREITKYQRKIGSLLYIVVITRLNIAFVVSQLSRFIINPRIKYYKGVDWVLLYLKNTRALVLQFGGDDYFQVASNALFVDNLINRKSS